MRLGLGLTVRYSAVGVGVSFTVVEVSVHSVVVVGIEPKAGSKRDQNRVKF